MKPVPVALTATLIDLGQRFAQTRRARELTQEDLANLADVSRSTIKALEGGHHGVSLGNTLKVFKALGLLEQIDQLLDPTHDKEMIQYAQRKLAR